MLSEKQGGTMAYAIHLICRPGIGGGWPENVTHDRYTKLFSSGYWDLAAQDAEALIGGWLYLHATKAEPSYYGGQVQADEFVTRTDVATPIGLPSSSECQRPPSSKNGAVTATPGHGPAALS